MGGKKKWFCPVVLPIILIDLNQFSACICSEKHLLLAGDGGWREWEIAVFLLVRCKTKQNEMKDSKYWKRHDK